MVSRGWNADCVVVSSKTKKKLYLMASSNLKCQMIHHPRAISEIAAHEQEL